MKVDFELWQGGVCVASTSGSREAALRDVRHYALMYAQDGPVKVYEVTKGERKEVAP